MCDAGTSTAPRLRHRWVRLRALLAVALLLGVGATPTLAAWTDSEQVSASFEAETLPPPTLTRDCQFRPGLLGIGARVRIYWAIPEGYSLDDIQVEASTSGLGSILAPLTGFSVRGNTEQLADGTYQTEVPANLLGGLLGLGSELEIAIVLAPDDKGDWTSEAASVASNAGLIVGLGGSCRNLT